MRHQTFPFTGTSGVTLAGRLDLPDGPARAFAVFAHCFGCTKQSHAAVRIGRGLAARGIGVLRFDFTGLDDDDAPYADRFSGNVGDILAAAQALDATGRAAGLLIGHSLGGAAALAAAAKHPDATGVVTIGAPFGVEHLTHLFRDRLAEIEGAGEAEVDLGGRRLRISRSFLQDLASQTPHETIARLDRPLLVLHAPGDRVVGLDHASKIFQAASHPKSFVALAGADHLITRPEMADYVAGLISAWWTPGVPPLASPGNRGDAPATELAVPTA